MTRQLAIQCSDCGAEYDLPEAYRRPFAGKALHCPACGDWWVPLASERGATLPSRLEFNLRGFRRPAAAGDRSAEDPPPDAGATLRDSATTLRMPVTAPGRPTSLRLVVTGPDIDRKEVFDLGETSFFIGRRGCHLNLPRARIPRRAIRLRRAEHGFAFSGLEGFAVPIGAVSVASGLIDFGSGVELELAPYRLRLATSATPGIPIADLEKEAPPPSSDDESREAPASGDPGRRSPDLGRDFLPGLELSFEDAEGEAGGEGYLVTRTPFLIGRGEADLILRDRRVSSRHARLEVTAPQVYTLEDLASTNGTAVNDRPISAQSLEDGDLVSFGGVELRFRVRRLDSESTAGTSR